MEKHYTYCLKIKATPSLDVYPQADGKSNVLQFKNLRYSVKIPYFFTADFESILEKIELSEEE